MCNIRNARWIITPRIAPQPWITCSGCGDLSPYQSSGKIRLNANGRKLDAWLIYRCLACDKTWNRPLIERRNIRDVDPATLEALHFSDPDWVRAREFDINRLRQCALRVEEFTEVDIGKEIIAEAAAPDATAIELKVALPTSLRLDRLLSAELGLSRSRLLDLYGRGRLRIDPDRKDVLRRRIKDGTRILLQERDET
jgi:hypothetical protein